MSLVTFHRFQLTSCASGRVLRGRRRRCWARPSFSPSPSASPDGAWSSVGWNWSLGRGLRGKNRRRKRRLLGAYRLPLTGTPPGPVTLAASEPWRQKRNISCRFKEAGKKPILTFAASITSNSTSSPSPTLRRNFLGLFLLMAVYREIGTIKKVKITVQPTHKNAFKKMPFAIPDEQKRLLWYHSCWKQFSKLLKENWGQRKLP